VRRFYASRARGTTSSLIPPNCENERLSLIRVDAGGRSKAITHQTQQTKVLLPREVIFGNMIVWDSRVETGYLYRRSFKVKRKWISRLGDINKELLLILSIIAAAGVVNFFIAGQRLVLTFYNLPTLMAAYYFGRRRAVESALASILFVVWMNLMNPTALGGSFEWKTQGLLAWSDMAVWAGFLLISAYATGSLYELGERRLNELRDTYYGVLQILNQFIGNDKFTQNHSYRVSVYATTIASEMRLPEQQIEDVRAAALLHDIGKLEISRDILYKAARLDEGETEEMKSHVEKGIRMLNPVGGSLKRVLPIILAHHDRFDGSGYHPSKGEEIPIEARIISVADAYDAMISDRPYRKGMSPIEARDTILKSKGSDFDPAVVKAFEGAFRKQKMEVPEVMV
jgi:putative nucleotidyltransferase with HDIG domain